MIDLLHSWFTVTILNHVMCIGLGNTVADIDVSSARVFPKTLFSMIIPEVEETMKKEENRKSVVLFGIEVSKIMHISSLLFVLVET